MKSAISLYVLRKWLGAVLLLLMAAGGALRAEASPYTATGSSYLESYEDKAVIEQAVTEATSRIQTLAVTDPEAFAAVLRQSFGSRLSPEVERDFVEKAAQRQLPLPDRILFVPTFVLPGAAAYESENGGAIYLNSRFRTNPGVLGDLVLHEWAHHLDAMLGFGDSPLEEGELFLLGVNSGGPVDFELLGKYADSPVSDHATIEYEGRTIEVELWSNPFKAIANFVKKKIIAPIKKRIIDPIVNIAKAVVKTVVKTVKSTVNLVKNVAKAVGNAVVGAARGVASGIMYATGNKKAAADLAAKARGSFGRSWSGVKGAAGNVLDRVVAVGDLYNKTTAELNKAVPHLGTALGIAASFTPAGPALAAFKGAADVKNAYDNGGWKSALTAGGFALLDVGGAKLGRVAKGIKGAKGLTRARGIAVTGRAGKGGKGVWNSIKGGLGKVKGGLDKGTAKTLDKWKYTRATAGEIRTGTKLINNYRKTTKVIGVLDKIKKADILVRSKDFVEGRDRDKDGKLLGTGGSGWNTNISGVGKTWNDLKTGVGGTRTNLTSISGGGAGKVKGVNLVGGGGFGNIPSTGITGVPQKVHPKLTIRAVDGTFGIGQINVKVVKEPSQGKVYSYVTAGEQGIDTKTLDEGYGLYSVVATSKFYMDHTEKVVIDKPSQTITIQLVQKPRINVEVTDSTGSRLNGVNLQLINKTDGKSPKPQNGSTSAGSKGFDLHDGPGDYSLVASLAGYQSESRELKVNESVAIEIVLVKPGEKRLVDLTGVLVELSPGHDKAYKDGFRIENASITIQAPSGTKLPASLKAPLKTNKNGEFSAKKVTQGTYQVSITAEGYEPYSGQLEVVPEMEELLLSLVPRNTARDNWIRKILTEGWGDTTRSREFHQSGVKEDIKDSNVDYALGLSSLAAKDEASSISAYTQAVGKVSNEHWWDRASEGYIWTLMNHHQLEKAASEIRRLVSSNYRTRDANAAGKDTAYMFGVAIGVMNGPWKGDRSTGPYMQLDTEIVASLQEPLLSPYLAGRDSVTVEYNKLSQAEIKAKQDLLDAAEKEKALREAPLRKKMQDLKAELARNTEQQKARNKLFVDYNTKVTATADANTTQLQKILADLEKIKADIDAENKRMLAAAEKAKMQNAEAQKLKQLKADLDSNTALQNTKNKEFVDYNASVTAAVNGYSKQLEDIQKQFTQVQNAIAVETQRARDAYLTQMQANAGKRLQQLKADLDNSTVQRAALDKQFTDYQAGITNQADGYSKQLQQIDVQLQQLQVQMAAAAKRAQAAQNAQMQAAAEQQLQGLQNQLNDLEAQQGALNQQFNTTTANYQATAGAYVNQMDQIVAQADPIKRSMNEWKGFPAVCQSHNPNFESDCSQCQAQQREKESKLLLLSQQLEQIQAQHKQVEDQLNNANAVYQQAERTYNQNFDQMSANIAAVTQQYNNFVKQMNNPNGQVGNAGMGEEMIGLQAQDTNLRNQYQQIQGLLTNLDNDYKQQTAQYQQNVNQLNANATAWTNEYNALAAQMANPAGQNPEGGNMSEQAVALNRQLSALQTQYKQVQDLLTKAQNDYAREEVAYKQQLGQLNAVATDLTRQYNDLLAKITNANANPNSNNDSQMTSLNAKATQLQARYQQVQGQQVKAQNDYASEEAKYKKDLNDLHELATGFTSQFNDLVTQLNNLPAPVVKPEEEDKITKLKWEFASYRKYPLEERKKELLDSVSRAARRRGL